MGTFLPRKSVANAHLILLDFRLRGHCKTGAETCRELESMEPTRTLPIIMISAEAELAHIAASCAEDSYLSKPFDVEELLKKSNIFPTLLISIRKTAYQRANSCHLNHTVIA